MDKDKIELGTEFLPKWNSDGLIPVTTIRSTTKEVLMLAYANEEAINLTLRTNEAHYYSRSRQKIWHKGSTSGQKQKIKKIYIDCDQDAVIYEVEATAINCHRGNSSCFYRELTYDKGKILLKHIIK